MIQDRLWLEVEKVADRYQQLRFWRTLAVGWLVAAMIGLGLGAVGLATAHDLTATWPILVGVAAGLIVICAWLVKGSAPGHDWIARQIEAEFPDLSSCLLAAVEQQPTLGDGRFGFLQESVIRQALVHAACHACLLLPEVSCEEMNVLLDRALLVDDASTDGTVAAALAAGLEVLRHPVNRGYGANQKTCYVRAALDGADIVVMVHGDNQYDPIPIYRAGDAAG